MVGPAKTNGNGAAQAARELRDLLAQVEQARAELTRVQQDVSVAARRLSTVQAAQLVEVNAKLLSATLHAQFQAETARHELETAAGGIDPLTRLPDQALTVELLERAIARARRNGAGLALVFVGIEQLEQFAATLGRKVADEMLALAAQSLMSTVRASDAIGRLGDHAFLVVLDDVADAALAALVAGRLIAVLAVPHHAGGQAVPLTPVIGLTVGPTDGEDAAAFAARAMSAAQHAR